MIKKILLVIMFGLTSGLSQAEIKPLPASAAIVPVNKSEVIEFFSFGCPHCFDFEPVLAKWKNQNSNVPVKKVAVGFNRSWMPLQRLYYTLETMNVPESRYADVFNALHVAKENLYTDDKVIDWAVRKGFDKRQFSDMYYSFSVSTKIKAAETLINAYNIESVPSIAVNGKYIVYAGKGGFSELLTDVDKLLKAK